MRALLLKQQAPANYSQMGTGTKQHGYQTARASIATAADTCGECVQDNRASAGCELKRASCWDLCDCVELLLFARAICTICTSPNDGKKRPQGHRWSSIAGRRLPWAPYMIWRSSQGCGARSSQNVRDLADPMLSTITVVARMAGQQPRTHRTFLQAPFALHGSGVLINGMTQCYRFPRMHLLPS